MKYSGFLASAAVVAFANAHATIWNAFVNDVNQGVGNSAAGYIRGPPNNNPLKDITSKDMTCNVNNAATAKTIKVAAGDKITLEWHHNDNSASDDIIDPSHVGPLMAYLAPTKSNGAGDVWVKVAENGYDGKTWAVQTLIANKGKWDFTLPSTLADGDYLIRGEIIALHEADTAFTANSARGAQFYMECIQISVTGGAGSTALPAGVAIPGAYSYSDPGVVFNVYSAYTSYKIPGPAVWDGKGSAAPKPTTSAAAPAPTTSKAVAVPTTSKAVVVPTTSTAVIVPTSSKAAVVVPTSAPVVTSAAPVATPSSTGCSGVTATTFITVSKPTPSAGTGVVAMYGRCGGIDFTGSTVCATGSTCKEQNPYYFQCV